LLALNDLRRVGQLSRGTQVQQAKKDFVLIMSEVDIPEITGQRENYFSRRLTYLLYGIRIKWENARLRIHDTVAHLHTSTEKLKFLGFDKYILLKSNVPHSIRDLYALLDSKTIEEYAMALKAFLKESENLDIPLYTLLVLAPAEITNWVELLTSDSIDNLNN
jgi:hypothetical protein